MQLRQDLPYTDDDEERFRSWIFADESLSKVNSSDDLRSRLFPRPSFLSAHELVQLENELMKSVYPRFCVCQTVLGETVQETTLIACEADGGCKSHRWFHIECMKVAKNIESFICPECK
jgi:hypothetical protein